MLKRFPYICECGYNTMNTERAYQHAQGHYIQEIKTNISAQLARMTDNLQGRMIYICPVGYESPSGATGYNQHGRAFYVSQDDLTQGEGIIACEYCETECIRLV